MMCLILGYDDDQTLDNTLLGFMNAILLASNDRGIIFNYAQY